MTTPITTDPKALEKALAKEEKLDAKQVHAAEKELKKVEKDHAHLIKKADKAVAKEHRTAEKVSIATHNHETAALEEQKAKELAEKVHHQRDNAGKVLEQKKASLDAVIHAAKDHDASRTERRSALSATSTTTSPTSATAPTSANPDGVGHSFARGGPINQTGAPGTNAEGNLGTGVGGPGAPAGGY